MKNTLSDKPLNQEQCTHGKVKTVKVFGDEWGICLLCGKKLPKEDVKPNEENVLEEMKIKIE